MEFGILGPTELIYKGEIVPLGSAKQRGMLATLLYHAGDLVRTDTVIDHLWGTRGPADPRPTLYSLASRLRAVLGQIGLENTLVRVPSPGGYRLEVDQQAVDFHRYRRLLADARTAAHANDHEAAAEIVVRALSFWRGEPLAELRGPRSEHLRRRMNETLLDAHKLLAESLLMCGKHDAVLRQLEPVIHDHDYDLDEALARSWVSALCAADRHDEAKRFLVAFRRRFRKEMHAEPDIDIDPTARRRSTESPYRSVLEPGPPHHLPKDISDFTGREAVLAELDTLGGPQEGPNNVVVITGMPGIGKTTLATHWAHRQRHHFRDGQLYIDAGAYGPTSPMDPNDVIERFLRALGVPPGQLPATAEQRRQRFNDLLNDRRMLIFIDNVLDPAQVRPLIPNSASCLTVITSRTRLSGLNIRDGVRTITVTPLSDGESAALLTHIVGAQRGNAEPDGLDALARLSGGLPLAVRIAGEHVAERPKAAIADLAGELHGHLLDVTDVDDQAANISVVFAWSYNALREDAARLFRRMSVHPGPSISAEAVAALRGTPLPDTESLLNALAKAHMISHDTAHRYRYHDLLRLYAAERSEREDDSGETRQAQRRLLDWYLLSAASAFAAIAPEWPAVPDLPDPTGIRPKSFETDTQAMKWCEAERDNLWAISRWALDCGYHRHGWQIPGIIREIFERYVPQDDVLKLNQLAWAAAQRDDHELGKIGTLTNLGGTYLAMHVYDQALAHFTTAHQLACATGHVEAETICSHNLACAYLSLGDAPRAISVYEKALAACRKIADSAGEAATLHRLGDAHLQMRQYQQSEANYLQSLSIRERIGALRGVGLTHSGLGTLHLAAGRLSSALHHCTVALDIHVHTQDQAAQCDTLAAMADIQRGLSMHDEAVRSGRQAVQLGVEIADSYRQARALAALADALVGSNDPVSAQRQVKRALRILDDLADGDAEPIRERLLVARQALARASKTTETQT